MQNANRPMTFKCKQQLTLEHYEYEKQYGLQVGYQYINFQTIKQCWFVGYCREKLASG